MKTTTLTIILLLASIASAVDCPPGFVWQRMSGVGCVQADCADVAKPNSHLSYTSQCICGTDDCVGNPVCVECYDPVNYGGFDKTKCGAFCPGVKLVACVKQNTPCPNEKPTTTTTKATTTTTKATTTTTTTKIDIQQAGTGMTLPSLSLPGIIQQPQENETPKNESCLDFGVQPKDFDLTYDDKELRKEFMDFLGDYMKNNEVHSASDKYAGWAPQDFAYLGAFMFTESMNYSRTSRFWTGNENTLKQRITQRFQTQNRPLTPSEVFEEALKANDNCVMDALLCTHNYMKTEVYEAREVRRNANMEIAADKDRRTQLETTLRKELISSGYIKEGEGGDFPSTVMTGNEMSEKAKNILKLMDTVDARIKKNEQLKANAGSATFNQLQKLRKNDNEGAWYHLYGTLTTGYAERENTWKWFGDSAYTRIELFGEHRIYKGLRRSGGIDLPEYCWDVWGGYLGGELYTKTGNNPYHIRQAVMEDTSRWMDLSEMGYVKDGYIGRHIYK